MADRPIVLWNTYASPGHGTHSFVFGLGSQDLPGPYVKLWHRIAGDTSHPWVSTAPATVDLLLCHHHLLFLFLLLHQGLLLLNLSLGTNQAKPSFLWACDLRRSPCGVVL